MLKTAVEDFFISCIEFVSYLSTCSFFPMHIVQIDFPAFTIL